MSWSLMYKLKANFRYHTPCQAKAIERDDSHRRHQQGLEKTFPLNASIK